MIIGVPKEVKNNENRVSAVPGIVQELVADGHTVYVEKGAGLGSGINDSEYAEAGAIILDTAAEVWEKAELIYKVKEPLESEYKYFKEGQLIYTYLHLAAEPHLTKALVDKKVTGIAFETVRVGRGLPLLRPMSEVAGRMAVQEGVRFLTKPHGGKGLLIQGVPGVKVGKVVIVGAGIAGTAAASAAVGLGANVTLLDVNIDRLTELSNQFGRDIETLYSTKLNIANSVKDADLVISTVLIPGAKAPKLITKEMVASMEDGSVIVDVAIDQGGSTEHTEGRPTTHDEPIFVEDGVLHYSVANIPGAVPITSSYALCNATSRYIKIIANLGLEKAIERFPELEGGVNTHAGAVTYKAVAEDLGFDYVALKDIL
ncbi:MULTISPECIES: alanine dehydrogenase [unclassified Gemella]|uniref:alanine dehydrogenase n=1 Tax=unclassified Gemella TaxID=2624949 RepID=UPI0010742518|nr:MULTISPECIES: alanine dehydrogenase [unclassified Gemella]MBF0710487.1 alanine dehydrogenase [Gemella sp. GL1.1]MBF0746571.1 alanine dehydrogenase [Gemella sp. 19428wG2_WT2a]NYS27831.1 alanine dehydrogenase [Gemella sp. GL1]TFU59931.1 alanine dehydrogenase [Gemella sp. WT2a]